MSSMRALASFRGALLAGAALLLAPAAGAQPEPAPVKSAEPKPAEPKPGEAKPGEAKPGEVKPGVAKPGEAKPGEAKPGEVKPGEAKPGVGEAPPPAETAAAQGVAGPEGAEAAAPVEGAAAPPSPPPAPAAVPARTWAPPPPPQPALAHDTRHRAVEEPDEPEPEPEGPYLPHWFSAEVGVRNFFILDEGFDPYSESDLFAGGAFTVSFVPIQLGPLGIGLTAEYDLGHRSGLARGIDSAVTLHRLGGGLQLQVLLSRLRFFARAMPAAWYAMASLNDGGFERQLEADGWTWGLDASGGLAVRLGSAGRHSYDALVRFWLLAELGYGFGGDIDMAFSPAKDDTDPRVFGGVSLPALQPSGLVNRLAFAVSF